MNNQDDDVKEENIQEEQDQMDDKDKRIQELTELLRRVQAEFENYKKRVEKQNEEFKKCANVDFIEKVLPVLDNFGLALKNQEGEEFKKGVELIYAQLFSVLEEEGLKPIQAEGQKFDPYFHEALMQEEVEGTEPGMVVEELQKGYCLGDKILRHSKVKVSK